ncbi:ARL14 protein, partial [Amia calva]|nr:ARL14 protein [Amia calva]
MKFGETVTTTPTIGFNVERIEMDRNISLMVWDVGGQQTMRLYWKSYCRDTDGIMFVVDSSNKERLEESQEELEYILRHSMQKKLPLVLLANKQDLPGALTAAEITREFNLKRMCCDRDWFVQPCSAKTGSGLEQGFRQMDLFVKTSLLNDNTFKSF